MCVEVVTMQVFCRCCAKAGEAGEDLAPPSYKLQASNIAMAQRAQPLHYWAPKCLRCSVIPMVLQRPLSQFSVKGNEGLISPAHQ